MKKLLILVLLGCAATAQASIIGIDLADSSTTGGIDPFTYRGYEFSFGPDPIPNPPAYINGFVVPGFAFCPGCEMHMEAANGSVFSLYSFEAYAAFGALDETLRVTGYFDDGSSSFADFDISDTAQSFALPWAGLTRVVFDNLGDDPTAMGIIRVSEVPLPAAFWLFGSALAGLGWMRRKQSV